MSAHAKVPHVLTVRCHWCQKERPEWRVHRLVSHQVLCDYCLEWHIQAQEFLAGHAPAGCQVCERSWEALKLATPGEQIRMYVVPKDGLLQLLCASCVRPYVDKRTELFKGTQFGKELKA